MKARGRALQIVTYARRNGEMNGAQRRTKISFDKTMMQELELLQLAKGMSLDKTMSYSAKIKPMALVTLKWLFVIDVSSWISTLFVMKKESRGNN